MILNSASLYGTKKYSGPRAGSNLAQKSAVQNPNCDAALQPAQSQIEFSLQNCNFMGSFSD